jgi:hypothetical protein
MTIEQMRVMWEGRGGELGKIGKGGH